MAVKLDVREDTRRERYFSEDAYLQQEALKARDGHHDPPQTATSAGHGSLPDADHHDLSHAGSEDEHASIRSRSTYESSIWSAESVDTMTEMGIFGDPSGNVEFQPLVHLWLDLEAHLKQEDIPSPLHFFEEIDVIIEIIQDARERNPSLSPLREPLPCGLTDEECSPDGAEHDVETREVSLAQEPLHRRRLRPWKLLRRVCAKLKQVFRLP
ncbi:hypothetical protein C8T65DRAFT_88175 [Cerioporus squamosus]|nr:hypothetical protein C8T65DRAFT_88175 [Cerioporus squamosus]